MQKRECQTTVIVDKEEYKRLKHALKLQGLTVSFWIRKQISKYVKSTKCSNDIVKHTVKKIKKLGISNKELATITETLLNKQ